MWKLKYEVFKDLIQIKHDRMCPSKQILTYWNSRTFLSFFVVTSFIYDMFQAKCFQLEIYVSSTLTMTVNSNYFQAKEFILIIRMLMPLFSWESNNKNETQLWLDSFVKIDRCIIERR